MSGLFSQFKAVSPGLLLSVTIAIAAQFIGEHLGGPVMMLALLIGTAFNFLADEEKCATGISFSSRIPLRVGIVLLGAAVTLGDLNSLGPAVVALVIGLVGLHAALGKYGKRMAWLMQYLPYPQVMLSTVSSSAMRIVRRSGMNSIVTRV